MTNVTRGPSNKMGNAMKWLGSEGESTLPWHFTQQTTSKLVQRAVGKRFVITTYVWYIYFNLFVYIIYLLQLVIIP